MKALNIKSDIIKYVYPTGKATYSVHTKEIDYGYELVNIADGEAEAAKIQEQHKILLEQMFGENRKIITNEIDDEIEEKPKSKRGRKKKEKNDDFVYEPEINEDENDED